MPTLVLDRAAELKSTLSFCEILFCPEDARRGRRARCARDRPRPSV